MSDDYNTKEEDNKNETKNEKSKKTPKWKYAAIIAGSLIMADACDVPTKIGGAYRSVTGGIFGGDAKGQLEDLTESLDKIENISAYSTQINTLAGKLASKMNSEEFIGLTKTIMSSIPAEKKQEYFSGMINAYSPQITEMTAGLSMNQKTNLVNIVIGQDYELKKNTAKSQMLSLQTQDRSYVCSNTLPDVTDYCKDQLVSGIKKFFKGE